MREKVECAQRHSTTHVHTVSPAIGWVAKDFTNAVNRCSSLERSAAREHVDHAWQRGGLLQVHTLHIHAMVGVGPCMYLVVRKTRTRGQPVAAKSNRSYPHHTTRRIPFHMWPKAGAQQFSNRGLPTVDSALFGMLFKPIE